MKVAENFAGLRAAERALEYRNKLQAIAAPAIPGTPENKAYHAKLDEINALAAEIRAKQEGR